MFVLIFVVQMVQAEILEQYAQSKNCKPCHGHLVKDWETSQHSKSHFSKNTLYKSSLEYMSKETHRSLEDIEIKCATCHNPRVGLKQNDSSRTFLMAFDEQKRQEVNEQLNTKYLKDGVNCIVCHNIDKVHESKDPAQRGLKAVEWGPNDTMVGPYVDAVSPYHKVAKREHFSEDPNKLCFVCHYSGQSTRGILTYETGMEYEASGSSQKCVDCHMSDRYEDVASTFSKEGGQKPRMIRSHLFAGARNGDILLSAVSMDASVSKGKLSIILQNMTPHRVPSGFGGRELILQINYKLQGSVVATKEVKLGVTYLDEKGKKTIPYLAASIKDDQRLNPKEKRELLFSIPNGCDQAEISLWYVLVGEDMAKLLKLTDKEFLKKYPVAKQKIDL